MVRTQTCDNKKLVCATCGFDVIYAGTGMCSRCMTPITLSRSVASRDTPFQYVAIMGQSGAGKTVYLGMLLDMLGRGHSEIKGVPNDAFSVAIQQETVGALERQRFPDKTPSEADKWKWVHFETHPANNPKKCLDVIAPDVAGEALTVEIEQTGTFPTIRSSLRRSNGAILLFDAERVRDCGRADDLFGIKSVTYLASLQQEKQKKRANRVKMPLAIVFTKTDHCPAARDNPARFAKEFLPGMVQVCEKKFANHQYFAASVVGSTGKLMQINGAPIQVPLHVQPRGVVEPFAWVTRSLGKAG